MKYNILVLKKTNQKLVHLS